LLAGFVQYAKRTTVWDAFTGEEVARFDDDFGRVNSLTFSPDGKLLATGNVDGTVLLWEMPRRPAKPAPAPTLKELDNWWNDLASADAEVAYRAIGRLAAAQQAAPFLQERLETPGFAERMKQLLRDLNNDAYAVRSKATAELEKAGENVRPYLLKALEGRPTLETKMRLDQLLVKLGPPYTSPAG